jgi:hypothetical protein
MKQDHSTLDERTAALSDRARARMIDSRLAIASTLCLVAAAHIKFEEFVSAESVIGRARAAAQEAQTLALAGKNLITGAETSVQNKLRSIDRRIFELQASLSRARLERRQQSITEPRPETSEKG